MYHRCPKTVENFCVHSRNGYFNGHIFHRVIKVRLFWSFTQSKLPNTCSLQLQVFKYLKAVFQLIKSIFLRLFNH